MAGYDYAKTAATADRLLKKYGQAGAIRRFEHVPGPTEFDPGTDVETDYPISVAVLPIQEKDVDGTLIKSGDQQALIAAKDIPVIPTTTDVVLVNGAFVGSEYQGGEAWTISSLKTLAPAGQVVLYDAVVTR